MGALAQIGRHADVFRSARAEHKAGPPAIARNKDEREFLPAALEVLETPPRPLGRIILWTIVLFASLAILWASLGHIDIVAIATGKTVPAGRVKVIQPLEHGVVRRIAVEDGQIVRQGDALVELDPTATGADVDRLRRETMMASVEVARLRATVAAAGGQRGADAGLRDAGYASEDGEGLSPGSRGCGMASGDDGGVARATTALSPGAEARMFGSLPPDTEPVQLNPIACALASFAPPVDATEALVAMQRRLMVSRLSEQRARIANLDQEIARLKAAERVTSARVASLDAQVPLIAAREAAKSKMARKGYTSRTEYLEIRQELVATKGDLATESHRLEEIRAQLLGAQEARAEAVSAFEREQLVQLATAAVRLNEASQELVKAERRQEERKLRSPVTGVVQQLAVHTVGGVVTPAQQLMVVVPVADGADPTALEVEVMIPNKDIGFVKAGQEAEVKVEAFPFTRYGVIPATVEHVSHDAVSDENMGLVYPARVRLSRSTMLVDGTEVTLTAGMAVTAEVNTGQRRLIEFVLAPITRYRDEALRER